MALVYHKQTDAYTSFSIWKIEETAEELVKQLQLRDHERSYLESLVNGKRNLHWLSTRVLLRRMMNTDQYIDCRIDENGKPYLINFPYYISLSHSYEYAAVMISKNKAVGIDIEIIKDKIERIARKFLNSEELAFIDQEQRTEHLYTCWCAKEAIYKLHGKRNISFLDDIRITPFEYEGSGSLEARLDTGKGIQTFRVFYDKFEDYMLGYVSDTENEE
jgi:4'-phosphopantetheinyl transferase